MKSSRRGFVKMGAAAASGLVISSQRLLGKKTGPEQMSAEGIVEAIKQRRSVRKFKPTPIPEEHLKKILEAANYAPSPRNRQAWKFLVIRDRKIIDQIKEECIKRAGENSRQYYTDYLSAPVYVVILAETTTRNPANDITAGALAAENLMITARALGYGTVFCVNSIPEEVTNQILNVPEQYKRICITPVGIPDKWPETPKKKALSGVVLYDTFK